MPYNKRQWAALLTKAFLRLAVILSALAATAIASQPVPIGDFSNPTLTGWEPQIFVGETRYSVAPATPGTTEATISAQAVSSASGLVIRQTIDLTKTPFLSWSWRANRLPEVDNEREKPGDDYAARVYVIFDAGVFKWRSRALNYVWASNQPKGSDWPNPYATKNMRMLALRNHSDVVDSQQSPLLPEKRNVREDFQRLFGRDIKKIHAVAIMTDADNSRSTASASYGQIQFTAQ